MASLFEVNRDVVDLIQNWRWEEPIKHNGKYTKQYPNTQSNNDSFDPKHYNYSYSEWRKCRGYYHTSLDEFYKHFITTLMPLRHGDDPSLHPNNECLHQIHEAINNCVLYGIPSSHLLIGTLYSSYHLVSPYMLPAIKYLLTQYSTSINLDVTSISNPRYTVAHIAAMSNDIELMQIFHDLGGDINVIDGSHFSPLYISFGKWNFRVSHGLLWMNAIVDETALSKKMCGFKLRHLMNTVACLYHFLFEIDVAIHSIFKPLQGMDISNDIIQSIVNFTLPVQSYQSIKRLLKKLECDGIESVEIPFVDVLNEAKQCLTSLIALKRKLVSDVNESELYPFGNGDGSDDEMFLNKLVFCNLFELAICDEKELCENKEWQKEIEKVLFHSQFKRNKRSVFIETYDMQNEKRVVNLKWMMIGLITFSTAAIVIKRAMNLVIKPQL